MFGNNLKKRKKEKKKKKKEGTRGERKGKDIEKGSERKINTFPYVCLNEERKRKGEKREQVENIISEFLITIALQQEYNFKSISLYICYE